MSAAQPPQPSRPTILLVAWLHLAALWALAVAQPLFGVLSDSPEFFVARGNTPADIVLVAVVAVVAPPTVLVLIEALFLTLPRVRAALHLAFIGALTATFVLQVLVKATDSASGLVFPLVALAGVAGALAYWRLEWVRSVLTVLSPVSVVVLVLFLFFSPVTELVFPEDTDVAGASQGGGTPVVEIVFDEFPGGALMNDRHTIDATRYPGFAALARNSTWYRNATTVSGSTVTAVPAIMTGQYPAKDALPTAADHPESLFTLLGRRYRMDVTEAATAVCPTSLCGDRAGRESSTSRRRELADDLSVVVAHMFAPSDLEPRLPAVDRTFGDFGGDDVADSGSGFTGADVPEATLRGRDRQFEAFLGRLGQKGSKPGLHFFHTTLPHVPWQYLPSGQSYVITGTEIPGLKDETWGKDPTLAQLGEQRFLLQTGYADLLIRRLEARLRRTGLWDRALVVVTADHGVSFHAGGPRRAPARSNLGAIASVPLFVKAPRQQDGRVVDADVRTIDILPTIADELGLSLPWEVDGRSAREASSAPRDRPRLDGLVTFDLPTFKRARDSEVRRMISLFGAEDGGAGIYHLGGAERVGRRPPAGPEADDLRVKLDSASIEKPLDPGAATVPVYIAGDVSGSAPVGTGVAAAVNGTIRAVSRTFEDGGAKRVTLIIPPSSLRKGRNDLELYEVRPGAPPARIPLEDETPFRLAGEGRGLVAPNGREIQLTSDAARGFVDVVDTGSGSVSGWATDGPAQRAADRVVAFLDGRFAGSIRPSKKRADLASAVGPGAAESGFTLALDRARLGEEDLRVFAVVGNRATELERAG